MTLFWLIAVGLAAAALVYVLRPLLAARATGPVSRRDANVSIYRDQLRELDADLAAGTLAREDYERARLELEARLLEDVSTEDRPSGFAAGRRSAIALGVAIPLLAVAVYMVNGNLRALDPRIAHAPDEAQIEAMVARLAARMRDNPDDAQGWKLLGRSYTVMGRFDDAAQAFARATQLEPRDPQLLADFADALAMTHNQSLEGEPMRLVERALEIDPGNLKALALAGTAAYERRDYAKAAELWGRMLPQVPAGSEDARMIEQNVDEARKLAGIGAPEKKAAKQHPGVRGTVRLSAKLKGQVKPDDQVFVFARAVEGPPMPLAVLRARAGELPLAFALDDSMAMAQGLQVSAFPRVVVTARVSKSGSARPAPGDLEGASQPVANDAKGVTVTIDTVVR